MDYKAFITPEKIKSIHKEINRHLNNKTSQESDTEKFLNALKYQATPQDFTKYSDFTKQKTKKPLSFDHLDSFTTERAKNIEQIISLLTAENTINPQNLSGNVIDFGMGSGAGAYVLQQQYHAHVTGIEQFNNLIQHALQQQILPQERIISGDGFQYLQKLEAKSLDFVAAFMMARDFPHYTLYEQSKRFLKPKGQLLITGSLHELQQTFDTTLAKYGQVKKLYTIGSEDQLLANIAFIYTKE